MLSEVNEGLRGSQILRRVVRKRKIEETKEQRKGKNKKNNHVKTKEPQCKKAQNE